MIGKDERTTELKSCPFCGGAPVERYPGGTAYGIECESCHIGTAYVCLSDYRQSVDAWNRRADECDREALLDVCREIEDADVDGCIDWADRIRNACGVKDVVDDE